jgi:hypothetical protein
MWLSMKIPFLFRWNFQKMYNSWRWKNDEFAPIKNWFGAPTDSPEITRQQWIDWQKQWSSETGILFQNEGYILRFEQKDLKMKKVLKNKDMGNRIWINFSLLTIEFKFFPSFIHSLKIFDQKFRLFFAFLLIDYSFFLFYWSKSLSNLNFILICKINFCDFVTFDLQKTVFQEFDLFHLIILL